MILKRGSMKGKVKGEGGVGGEGEGKGEGGKTQV